MPQKVPEKQTRKEVRYFLGIDGGGTKTDCVLADSLGAVLASAATGPSNPLRAGYTKACIALGDAAYQVLANRRLKPRDIRGVCAGIAGAGREKVSRRMSAFLEDFFSKAAVEITTDLAITLESAVGEGEGIVLIAGTGSAAYGRNLQGKIARAGGRGPWFSDEGSAFDIGRNALDAAVRAEEGRGPATEISRHILESLGAVDWAQLIYLVAKSPDDVFPRAFPLVARLGDEGDAVSRAILSDAADSLAGLAASVIDALGMKDRKVSVAKAGGTIGRSKFFDAAIDSALHHAAPQAQITALEISPAEAAARRALRNGTTQAHAG